jgi:hypothetical protein
MFEYLATVEKEQEFCYLQIVKRAKGALLRRHYLFVALGCLSWAFAQEKFPNHKSAVK